MPEAQNEFRYFAYFLLRRERGAESMSHKIRRLAESAGLGTIEPTTSPPLMAFRVSCNVTRGASRFLRAVQNDGALKKLLLASGFMEMNEHNVKIYDDTRAKLNAILHEAGLDAENPLITGALEPLRQNTVFRHVSDPEV
jgi:hypothetical protein